MTKHFINLDDLSTNDLQQIIDQAITLKKQHKSGEINKTLENKTLDHGQRVRFETESKKTHHRASTW